MTPHSEALKAASFALNAIPNTRLNHPSYRNSYEVAAMIDNALAGKPAENSAMPAAPLPAPNSDRFTIRAEAACCLWEAMIELREKKTEFALKLDKAWNDHGTVAMRHVAIALAPLCCDVYEALGEGCREFFPSYDWDFCPAFLAALPADWGKWGIYGVTLPALADCVSAMNSEIERLKK